MINGVKRSRHSAWAESVTGKVLSTLRRPEVPFDCGRSHKLEAAIGSPYAVSDKSSINSDCLFHLVSDI